MKVAALSLCILTGVVDTKNDSVVVLEVTSSDNEKIEYISLVSDTFPPDFKEGNEVTIATFIEDELQEYCQTPL